MTFGGSKPRRRPFPRAARPQSPPHAEPAIDRPPAYAPAQSPVAAPKSPLSSTLARWGRAPILLGSLAGFVLCLLALLLYQGLAQLRPTLPDPAPASRALCSALQTQDYATLYSHLSTRLRAQGTEAQFTASQRRLDIQRGSVTRCSAAIQQAGDTRASANLTIARGDAAPQTTPVTLVYESGAWRLDAYDAALVVGARTWPALT